MNERSARALLGVSQSATTGQIKRAYRRLALDLHPDRGGDPAAFQRLVEAQHLLLARPAPLPTAMPARRVQWVGASASADSISPRPRPRPRQTFSEPVRRRSAVAQHRPQRQFGDVLAEKLAAA